MRKHTEWAVSSSTLVMDTEAGKIVADVLPLDLAEISYAMDEAIEHAKQIVRDHNSHAALVDACREAEQFIRHVLANVEVNDPDFHDMHERVKAALALAEKE